jgi:hypothetical protein
MLHRQARFYNRANGKTDIGELLDLGPWCT